MHIERSQAGSSVAVLTVRGDMWHTDVWTLHRTVKEMVEDEMRRVVIDLTHVKRISSEGFGVIAASAQSLEAAGGTLRLAGANPTLSQQFELFHMTEIVDTHATLEDAVNAFR